MIYFARDRQIEVCETPAGVARLEARGFVRVSPERFRALWRGKDQKALAAMVQAVQAVQAVQERAVGETPGLPSGYKLFRG